MKVAFSGTMGSVARITGGTLLSGSLDSKFETITTDSRDLGNGNLFIPLIGEKFDGHDYIEELAGSGKITGYLTMKDEQLILPERYFISAIRCRDTLAALGNLARDHREKMDPYVIGITGTNGKTTTKELIHSVLSTSHSCLKNEKNYNNEIGLPFTLLGLEPGHEMAIVELGMNHANEIDRLSAIARPDMAVVTNAGPGHLEFLKNVHNVALAKSEIFNGMQAGGKVFVNKDTEEFTTILQSAISKDLRIITYGINSDADITPDDYTITLHDISLKVKGNVYCLPLYGLHNVYNMLAALAIAYELNIDEALIQTAFEKFSGIGGRSSIIQQEFTVIDDTYNSNPLSVYYALVSMKLVFHGKKIAVLGDMKELGESSPSYHHYMGKISYENGVDLLVLYGDMVGQAVRGAIESGMAEDKIFYSKDKKEITGFLLKHIKPGDVVLVKGSRSMKMEDIVEPLVR